MERTLGQKDGCEVEESRDKVGSMRWLGTCVCLSLPSRIHLQWCESPVRGRGEGEVFPHVATPAWDPGIGQTERGPRGDWSAYCPMATSQPRSDIRHDDLQDVKWIWTLSNWLAQTHAKCLLWPTQLWSSIGKEILKPGIPVSLSDSVKSTWMRRFQRRGCWDWTWCMSEGPLGGGHP